MPFAFELEYAKSNRSACKQCKEKIDKDAVRIGLKSVTELDADADPEARKKAHTMEATKWHHDSCFQRIKGVAWFKKNLPEEGAKGASGFDALKEEDQAKVEAIFAACRGEAAAAAEPASEEASTPPPGGKKRKADPAKAEGASTQKKSKFFADKASAPAESALSKDQQAAIEAAKAELSKKNLAALGMMLAKNGLPKSGKKEDLLERAAEAKALGVPPVCPTCDKAKLRFSKVNGTFSCPGFFDDEAKFFKKCKGPAADAELVRTPWQELGA
eukprot:gb/GFBE01045416.1/.p1 GENE.gb/GFBE01045416.1/~~gb/GFBE01045416.1/.p1  ORF type:complete len:273 (+),score=109.19 gb/GFBE01045416.1/:1-819(+)